MTEAAKILQNTAVLGAAKIIERASTVILGIVVARMLGPTGLGVYSAAMVYYGLVSLAAEMGASNYVTREIARDPDSTGRYFVHVAGLSIVVAFAVMAGSTAVVPLLGYSQELRTGVYVIICAVLPGALRSIQESVFVARQRVAFITYACLMAACVNVAVSIYLLHRGVGIVSLVVAFVIVQYLMVLVYFYFLQRHVAALTWHFDPQFAWTALKEMRTFTAVSILGGLLARPEIFLLSLLSNETQIGYYGAAFRIVDIWQLIPQTYMTNVYPVLSRSYHLADENAHAIRDSAIKYLLAVSLPLAAGIVVLAQPIIEMFYGSRFAPSVPMLVLLAWNVPVSALFAILWRVLAARGQQGSVLRAQLATVVVRIGSGAVLIGSLGALGAAITTPASLLFNNALLLSYLRRDGTVLSIMRLAWRMTIAAAVMGSLTYLLRTQLQLWFLVPVAVFAYAVVIIVFRAFARDDFASLRTVWGRK
ncbi:MAG: flippase [Terriglobales bacterium]